MSITIRDVARESGVCIATVSRVLHKKNVAPEISQKVLKVIHKLGYDPYRNIPLVKRLKTKSIGMVVPQTLNNAPLGNEFYSTAVLSLKETLEHYRYQLTLFTEKELSEKTGNGFSRANVGVDGLVFYCTNCDVDPMVRVLKGWGLPVVLIRRTTTVGDVVTLSDSDRRGARAVLQHLYDLGHRRIGLFTQDIPQVPPERKAAYREFIREKKMPFAPSLIQEPDDLETDETGVARALAAMLAGPVKPTALFAYRDIIGVRLIKALHALKLTVPHDLSVAGYDNTEVGRHFHPSLTTVNIPIQEMVSYAGRLLAEMVEGKKPDILNVEFKNSLIIRESTGPGPGSS